MAAYVPVDQQDEEDRGDRTSSRTSPMKEDEVEHHVESSKNSPSPEKMTASRRFLQNHRVFEEIIVLPGFRTMVGMSVSTMLLILVLFLWLKFQQLTAEDHWFVDWSQERFSSSEDAVRVVEPSASFGAWEGWGTSLSWWANVAGDREEYLDLFFTLKQDSELRLYRDEEGSAFTLPGLGLTIARYNAGGHAWRFVGENQGVPSSPVSAAAAVAAQASGSGRMVVSPNEPPFKMVEGFWLDPSSQDPESSSWDWSVDANQVAALKGAVARGCNLVELFSNSPMWWMLRNRNPSGFGALDNLDPSSQHGGGASAHAVYLATVAEHFQTHWGVTFTSVEGMNEPLRTWWVPTGTQEGCHFGFKAQAQVVTALRKELDARGLYSTVVAASDENTYDDAVESWRAFDQETRGLVGQVNVHGYQQGQGRRDLLYEFVRGPTPLPRVPPPPPMQQTHPPPLPVVGEAMKEEEVEEEEEEEDGRGEPMMALPPERASSLPPSFEAAANTAEGVSDFASSNEEEAVTEKGACAGVEVSCNGGGGLEELTLPLKLPFDQKPSAPLCPCTKELNPVCGSCDGLRYANPCLAKCAGNPSFVKPAHGDGGRSSSRRRTTTAGMGGVAEEVGSGGGAGGGADGVSTARIGSTTAPLPPSSNQRGLESSTPSSSAWSWSLPWSSWSSPPAAPPPPPPPTGAKAKLWNSEYGDADGSGVSMAANMHSDFHELHPSAWVFWQVLDDFPGWGLIQFQGQQGGDLVVVNPKYFVLAHFTRHIRPGMQILGTSRPDTVAAFSAADKKLVLVTSNFGKARWVTHDLSRFKTIPKGVVGVVRRWRTEASEPEGDRYAECVAEGEAASSTLEASPVAPAAAAAAVAVVAAGATDVSAAVADEVADGGETSRKRRGGKNNARGGDGSRRPENQRTQNLEGNSKSGVNGSSSSSSSRRRRTRRRRRRRLGEHSTVKARNVVSRKEEGKGGGVVAEAGRVLRGVGEEEVRPEQEQAPIQDFMPTGRRDSSNKKCRANGFGTKALFIGSDGMLKVWFGVNTTQTIEISGAEI